MASALVYAAAGLLAAAAFADGLPANGMVRILIACASVLMLAG